MPGALSLLRGLGFLTEILQLNPALLQQTLVVASGIVWPEAKHVSRAFVEAGGMLIDRRLEDAELEKRFGEAYRVYRIAVPAVIPRVT